MNNFRMTAILLSLLNRSVESLAALNINVLKAFKAAVLRREEIAANAFVACFEDPDHARTAVILTPAEQAYADRLEQWNILALHLQAAIDRKSRRQMEMAL